MESELGRCSSRRTKKSSKNLIKEEEWIIDGNYGGTMDLRLNAADTIIFLDIHRTICVYRAFKRIVQYRNKTRPDMGAGCEERLDQLSKGKEVIILKSPNEVKRFLKKYDK